MTYIPPPRPTAAVRPVPTAAGRQIVLWTFWGSIVAGACFFRFAPFEPISATRPEAAGSIAWLILLGVLAMSSLLSRLFFLPRSTEFGKVLVALIVGVSFADALPLLGRFVFPGHLDAYFGTGAALLLLHCPLFVRLEPLPAATGSAEPQLRGDD